MKMKNILITMLFFGLALQMSAQGDLLVSPVRVIFEGNKQKEEISLVNIGNDTTTYSVSFLQYNMNEDGNFVLIENPGEGQMFADPYLRIFPRKVTLAPHESQVVRLQLRRKPDMMPGEYRSHLYFRSEKESAPLSMEAKKDAKLMSIQITPVFGISIPVIIRSGDVKASSELSDMRIENQQDTITNLKFVINRTGNMSVYGDIIAEYIPTKGKTVEIGLAKGVAVYTSISKRNFSVRIKTKGLNLETGKVKLRFTSPKDSPYELYAEKELLLKKGN
jgi:P pilus assembly chaperone PapD